MYPLNCVNCKKVFYVPKHRVATAKWCSIDCRKIKFNCLLCHKPIIDSPSRIRKYCSKKCSNIARMERIFEPKHPNSFRKFWKRRGIIEKCQNCGYDEVPEILGIHHIDENRKNNKRENLLVVCPNCHSLIHRKHIPH